MGERCKHAYRKRGKNAVFCRAIEGDADYCGFQQMCWQTQRFEATRSASECELKKKPAVK